MTSKGVKVQSKVTFDKPVTGFFALLQGATSCFARRENVSRGASRTGVVHIEVWAALRTPVAFESSVAPVLPFNLNALT